MMHMCPEPLSPDRESRLSGRRRHASPSIFVDSCPCRKPCPLWYDALLPRYATALSRVTGILGEAPFSAAETQ